MIGVPPAMVFAAGFGTRMGVLTRTRPKPLIPVAGAALIDHVLDMAAEGGVTRAVVNTHYLADQVTAHLAERREPLIRIAHEPDILDTGGGLRAALPLLGGDPVLTLNSDALWAGGGNPVATLLAAWRPGMEALLLLVPRERAVAHEGPGDFSLDDGRCVRRGSRETAPFVYTGAQILNTGALSEMPREPFSLNLLWDAMIARGGVFGLVYSGRWADVGRPSGIAAAEAMLQEARP